jgi:ankyrin repeat protein
LTFKIHKILEDVIKQEGFCHLESRTDPTDGHQMTPLLCAVKGNAVETFVILISNGADITAKDMNGLGVAEVAVLFASIDVFEHLLLHRSGQSGISWK